ncbi:MAG: Rpn family recombination-promoting nuclease/putative transposase [Ruminococcus sp.]|nr:Rpn family recombination-promoting nuclease/putative transposase [Ruminococcus sp.]
MSNDDFIMSPKVDFAFKEIMFNDKVRKGFLSAVLEIPVNKIKKTVLKNTNLQKIHADEKQGILDVYLVMNDDTQIDIEIQLAYMASWADRSAFYVSKMLVEQINIDKKYSNFQKCIGINLLDFNYIKDTDRFHTVYHISEDTEHFIYTDIMEWHVVELPKLPAIDDGSDLYNWVRFIKAERKEEFEMLAKKDEYIEEAYKQLEIISQDEQKRLEYTARQKAIYDYNTLIEENYNRGEATGIKKGIKQGIEQATSSIAEKMRAKGYSEQEIAELLS